MTVDTPKIVFFVTEDWSFCSHRLPVARAARDAGYEVVVICQVNKFSTVIENEGFRVIPVVFERGGLNPLKDLSLLRHLFDIMRKEQPDILHNVALKPIIYGSLAAMCVPRTKVINAFIGLGMVFSRTGIKFLLLRFITCMLIFIANMSSRVFALFQNPDDLDRLCSKRILSFKKSFLIRGSGVDTSKLTPVEDIKEPPVVLFASRLLWSKGIGDLVEVARFLKDYNVQFVVVGSPDFKNADAVPESHLIAWQNEGIIEWWGHQSDMIAVFAQSSIAVLPSTYGEGVPKFLIEASSCGLPVVAYDVPGCREIVHDGENGFLVSSKNVDMLANRIEILLNDIDLRHKMGRVGRALVEAEFSELVVTEQTMKLYQRVLNVF